MTQQEYNIIDRQLRNISIRNILTLVICTATSVATITGVYYGLKTDQALMKLEIKVLEQRIEMLEKHMLFFKHDIRPKPINYSES
jgi:hypothetical protein